MYENSRGLIEVYIERDCIRFLVYEYFWLNVMMHYSRREKEREREEIVGFFLHF
mgnify:CR=1 FL=1